MPVQKVKSKVQERPTESVAGFAGVVAALLAQLLGIKNADTVSEIAILLGALPSVVTYFVARFKG